MNFIGKSSDAALFAQEGLCRLLLRGATAASRAGRTRCQLPLEPGATLMQINAWFGSAPSTVEAGDPTSPSQHPHSHLWRTLHFSSPRDCHPSRVQQKPNHPQLHPNALETGLFLVSGRFKFIPCLESISPAADVSVRMTSPYRAALCAYLGVLGQPGSSGLQIKVCISLAGFLNYLIFLVQI